MRTYLECLPCIMRQSLDAAKHATEDEALREEIIRRAAGVICEIDFSESSPVPIGTVHRIVREVVGTDDPYRSAKHICNCNALKMYAEMKEMIRSSADPLKTALRLAAAGNIIDFVVDPHAQRADILSIVEHAVSAPFADSPFEQLREALESSQSVLYLGDNAGEIVFDRLLIETLPTTRIAYVVKGGPVVNDVTMEDAAATGMTDVVEVIDTGSNMPGTVFRYCSESFRKRFEKADLILSKGQGNYESLSESDKTIFFLFRAKCDVIAKHLGCEIGSLMLRTTRIGSPVLEAALRPVRMEGETISHSKPPPS